MILVAQRVVKPENPGLEGINAYRYRHETKVWPQKLDEQFINEANKFLEKSVLNLEVSDGGNRVRSFLDVVAPNGTAKEKVQSIFERFLSQVSGSWQFPFNQQIEEMFFSFYSDPGLAPVHEAKHLFSNFLWDGPS